MSKNKPIEIAEIPSSFLAFDSEFEAEVFDKFLKKWKGKFYESCD